MPSRPTISIKYRIIRKYKKEAHNNTSKKMASLGNILAGAQYVTLLGFLFFFFFFDEIHDS